LFVPLLFKNDLIGLIILGKKESGTFFSAEDIEFLTTLANQSALSIANALAYQKIREFNVALEKEVQDRTQALAHTNVELHQSLTQLESAYRDLQRSQENLVRAEKMADLGRLTAGIAHEMNTPLGASLTSLKLLKNLVKEYRTSIGDDVVTEHDHQEIAAEMDQLIDSTQQWMKKAAAHIRSLKLHTRGAQRGEECFFPVLQVVEDTRMLLAHRLRLSGCTITVSCHDENPMLYGDPSKLGQVLTNLLGNAVDAYKDVHRNEGNILITVNNEPEGLEIRVKDEGCGIPPEDLDRIFDDLFSTKPLGEGTGLGLPISRNIMSNFFGGDIRAESALGLGSTFILRFPRQRNAAVLTATAPQLAQDSSTEVIV
jgi:C4-dicarboxylate-specific signal transduction histidine kinase